MSRSLHRAEPQAMAEPARRSRRGGARGGAGAAEPAPGRCTLFYIDFAHEAGDVPTPKATAGGIGAGLLEDSSRVPGAMS